MAFIYTQKRFAVSLCTVLLASLWGCGGGSGSSTGTRPAGANGGAHTANDDTLVTTLNSNRTACGFGALTRTDDLQDAATDHALYLISEMAGSTSLGHYETNTSNFYYTGNAPVDRITFQGYSWSTYGENLATGITNPATAVRGLMATPYHTLGLVANHVDVGTSHQVPSPQVGAVSAASVIVSGVRQGGTAYALPAANTVLTFPCAGVTNTARGFANESPNWTGGSGGGSGGQTVVIVAPNGEALNITTATITPLGGSTTVTATLLTNANDPSSPKYIKTNQAALIPHSTLAASTTYTVDIAGTTTPSGGSAVPFTKNFTFTTGI